MFLGAAGLACSAGLGASSACAAMRAGIGTFAELPYWDRKRLPVIGAAVPGLSLDCQFGPRLVELLAMALGDWLASAPSLPLDRVPLLVGLPEPGRPGSGTPTAEDIIAQVQARLGVGFHPALSKVIPKGHTAGFEGLRVARDLMRQNEAPGCLVCGVDSHINASALFWLDRTWRLKRQGHTDGVIPGEAAAAIYVQRNAPEAAPGGVEVVGLGFGFEDAGLLSEQPLLALGLAGAGRQALAEADLGVHQMDFRLSDVTGENYGFRELTLAEGRLARVVRKESQPLWHPADSIGDTGAAAGVVQLVRAAAAWAKGYAPGARAICYSSAVAGERAVALLCRRTN
jgi:3-oxoacyl-[acyl-carrier-protein] synthase I